MERAKELLRSTGLSVTEVSLEVGFRSLGSFSTAFRALVGEPPSEYAARWRAADAGELTREGREDLLEFGRRDELWGG
jgi:AraC-like DNA-binding protein